MLLAFFAALLVFISVIGTILALRLDGIGFSIDLRFKNKDLDLRLEDKKKPAEKEKLPEAEEQRYLR
jgi:hypothetical protein